MIGPQLWATRALIALAVFLGGLFVGGRVEHDQLTVKFDHERFLQQDAMQKALQKAMADNAAALADQQAKSRKASHDYETALATLHAQYAAAGSLRLPASVCRQPAAASEATSTGKPDDTAASAVLVPQPTANDLLELTKKADELSEQLRALQQWIKDNGLGG